MNRNSRRPSRTRRLFAWLAGRWWGAVLVDSWAHRELIHRNDALVARLGTMTAEQGQDLRARKLAGRAKAAGKRPRQPTPPRKTAKATRPRTRKRQTKKGT